MDTYTLDTLPADIRRECVIWTRGDDAAGSVAMAGSDAMAGMFRTPEAAAASAMSVIGWRETTWGRYAAHVRVAPAEAPALASTIESRDRHAEALRIMTAERDHAVAARDKAITEAHRLRDDHAEIVQVLRSAGRQVCETYLAGDVRHLAMDLRTAVAAAEAAEAARDEAPRDACDDRTVCPWHREDAP